MKLLLFNIRVYRYLTISAFTSLLFCSVNAQKQDSMYVGNGTNIYTSNTGDTMSVFGNVVHNGVWGTTTGSYVYFLGQTWKNSPASQFSLLNATVTDSGGIFNIKQPLSLSYSQVLKGGFDKRKLNSGPIFPNIEISNPNNVYLDSTDVAVLNTVKMDTGLVYMSANAGGLPNNDNTQNSFVLGGGGLKPQVINYNRDKYFVSGVLPNDTSYFYVRNLGLTDTMVFPVGSKGQDFTPAGISGTTGDVMVRAFDGVYQNGNSGSLVSDSSYLKKSWEVVTPLSAKAGYNLILQHHLLNETQIFTGSRGESYISRYNGNGGWDTIPPNLPAYVSASLFPNIGNDGDSVFYHWRVLNFLLGQGQVNLTGSSFYTKRVIASNTLSIEKSVVGIEPVLADSTFNIMFKIAVTNTNKIGLNNIAISDNLSRTFGYPGIFKVSSVHSTNGVLPINNRYSGTGSDTLLVTNGSLGANVSDTLYVLVSFNLNGSDVYTYTNTAYGGLNPSGNQLANILDSSSATFNISPLSVFIPDGFSPNGDGINDRYVIGHTANQTIDLTVFNRWGNIVFKENNYKNDWDGKGVDNFLGKDLEEGTYYVLVKIHDKQKGNYQVVKFITLRRAQ